MHYKRNRRHIEIIGVIVLVFDNVNVDKSRTWINYEDKIQFFLRGRKIQIFLGKIDYESKFDGIQFFLGKFKFF